MAARHPVQVIVTLTPPPGASTSEIIEYIFRAVRAERGALHPEDPMSELDVSAVTVHRMYKKKGA
jgi:hypothetical protein